MFQTQTFISKIKKFGDNLWDVDKLSFYSYIEGNNFFELFYTNVKFKGIYKTTYYQFLSKTNGKDNFDIYIY